MNPSNNETGAGLQLPPPVEQAPNEAPQNTPEAPAAVPEAPAAAEKALAQSSPGVAMPIPLPTAPPSPTAQAAQSNDNVATKTSRLMASADSDLIEKEWVHKAKQIVEHTRDDPYKQSEELTLVKVDYMKKRYNKTIKLK